MDRLFALLICSSLCSTSFAKSDDFGAMITEGYKQQAQSYEKMEMHPRSLEILKSLAQTSPSNRKIKMRLIKKRTMVASAASSQK